MKASIYRLTDGVFIAILRGGRQIMRGNLSDLTDALRMKGIVGTDLLFGDWNADAELLPRPEQKMLMELMLERTNRPSQK